jgi:hypothetical protein
VPLAPLSEPAQAKVIDLLATSTWVGALTR